MKFSIAFVASILSACVLASATPMQTSHQGGTKMMCKSTDTTAVGALYFLTNMPQENMVVVSTIGSDGSISLDRAVATGGRGLHGAVTAPAPDSLFSQSSLQASANGKVLAAVNAGSNTVSLFTIDPKAPANLTPFGDPIASEGEFPTTLTFNKAGNRVCVANTGAVPAVNCFSVDQTLGLVSIPNSLRFFNLTQTTPPNGPTFTVGQIVFNEDESQLILTVKGAPGQPGFYAVWDVAQDGSLSPKYESVSVPAGGAMPFSITPIPGQGAFVVTDPVLGALVQDFSGKNRSSAFTINGQNAVCWSTHSSKTNNYYLIDAGGIINEVSIDSNLKASLVKQYPQTNNSGNIDADVVTVNGKDFLYVLASSAVAVDTISLAKGAGKGKQLKTLDVANTAKHFGVNITTNSIQGLTHFLRQ